MLFFFLKNHAITFILGWIGVGSLSKNPDLHMVYEKRLFSGTFLVRSLVLTYSTSQIQ